MEEIYPTGPIANLVRQISVLQHLKNKKKDRFKTLTDRQIEVLALIARGMKNPAIAEELGISRLTVQNHRSLIRQKLGINSQTEYITYALAYDLIPF